MDEFTKERRRLVAESLTARAAAAGRNIGGPFGGEDAKWHAWADLALFNAACTHETLTADEVWWPLKEHRIHQPWEPKTMSGVITGGRRSGWTERTEVFRTNPVPATHRHKGRAQRVWKSLIFGTAPAAWPE
jgi:hypothetical protein